MGDEDEWDGEEFEEEFEEGGDWEDPETLKWHDGAFEAGWKEVSETELDEMRIIKESVLLGFVDRTVTDLFNSRAEGAESIRDCLCYLMSDFDTFMMQSDLSKEELERKILAD